MISDWKDGVKVVAVTASAAMMIIVISIDIVNIVTSPPAF